MHIRNSVTVCCMESRVNGRKTDGRKPDKGAMASPLQSLERAEWQPPELCEISLSKKILSEVAITLRFGLNVLALFDKLSALTSIKPFSAPKPGNPFSSPPPPSLPLPHSSSSHM